MSKRKFLIVLIVFCGFFFLLGENNVKSASVVISQKPVSEEIIYGHPLYSSSLTGGISNAEGTFSWKDENKVLEVGDHEETVVFTSLNGEQIEFGVNIKVLPKRVYLEFENQLRKQYDGNDSIKQFSYVVKGIIDSSVYVKGFASLRVDSFFVGERIKVNIDGICLEGKGKENYYLDLDGFFATIHPKYIEKFGNEKNKIEFSEDIYVPVNSVLQIEEREINGDIEGYEIKKVFSLGIYSAAEKVKIDDKVTIKLNIDSKDLDYKRIVLYNYYNGKYQKLDYEYSNGELVYSCYGIGDLIITSRNYNYTWLYVGGSILLLSLIAILIFVERRRYNRIKHYKSIKRSRDYGNYL